MGDYPSHDGDRNHGFALGRTDRYVRIPGARRSLRAQTGTGLVDPGLFETYRPHRLLAWVGSAADLQLADADRACWREPRRPSSGHRDRSQEVARHSTRRLGRWLSLRLSAVLAHGACRGAAMGM